MLEDLIAFFEACASGEELRGEVIGRDQVYDYTIDTCYTADCGWETAVWKDDNPMVIVARYETKEEAEEGHDDWCAVCLLQPDTVWSIQTERYEDL